MRAIACSTTTNGISLWQSGSRSASTGSAPLPLTDLADISCEDVKRQPHTLPGCDRTSVQPLDLEDVASLGDGRRVKGKHTSLKMGG